jgi:spore germination protein YaaH
MRASEFITEAVKQRLDPKCWKGYRKQGTKVKDGVRVNNCVKEELSLDDEFNNIEEMIESIAMAHGVDPEVVWEDFESIDDDSLYAISEDWQKVNKKDKTDGMSRKAVKAYRRENPGSKLKTAVTTKPSKLKKGSKASKRRKSYCSRSAGQKKMHNIDCSKTPDKAICKARRRWNC